MIHLLIAYVVHIFVCRWMYVRTINMDRTYDSPAMAFWWFFPVIGFLVQFVFLMICISENKTWRGNWFIPRRK